MFDAMTFQGLPDIRILVFRDVPVVVMLRLLTPISDGKAHLHRSAIDATIDRGQGSPPSATSVGH